MPPHPSANGARRPARVLFVYYSYTQQTQMVVQGMAEALRGCEVQNAAIEFTHPRYSS